VKTGFLLTVAYDGTNYSGWQRQKNAYTVQQAMEETLSKVFNQPIVVTGASRTDAGVHALGQRVCFSAENISVPLNKIPLVLNNCLPEDIAVFNAEIVPLDFNPRYRAREKTYQYRIDNDTFPNPFLRKTTWYYPFILDVDAMKTAAAYFMGEHDFAAFRSTGTDYNSTVRELFECSVTQEKKTITITVRGNAFLYNMARIIAGTLVYVGRLKIKPADITCIIASKDRTRAGITAPPHGLTLVEIKY
jgi:tRNA pseudouridine38-40 synthase